MMTNISVIYRYGYIYIRKQLREYKLGQIDYIFLSFISKNYYVNQDYLCEFLLIEKGTIAKTAAKLEERGYICRKVNNKDKREKIICLTDSGKEIVEKIKSAIKEWNCLCFDGFTEEEKIQYTILNEKIAKNAVEYIKKDRGK